MRCDTFWRETETHKSLCVVQLQTNTCTMSSHIYIWIFFPPLFTTKVRALFNQRQPHTFNFLQRGNMYLFTFSILLLSSLNYKSKVFIGL